MNFGVASVFFLASLVLSQSSSALTGSQRSGNDSVLDRQINQLERGDRTIVEAARIVLGDSNTAGGVVVLFPCDKEITYTFGYPRTTLRSALDSIVRSAPDYQWFFDGKTINILPTTGEPPLLTTRMRHISIDSENSTASLVQALFQSPEVRDQLSLGIGTYDPEPGQRKKDKTKISLKETTVRDALNSIAGINNSVWLYQQWECREGSRVQVSFISN
jgi:hypothetical protein